MPPLAGWTLSITEALEVVEENVPVLNDIMSLLVSDFFIPVLISLFMLGIWLYHPDPAQREYLQRHVMNAAVAIGISTLVVTIINVHPFWPRPFDPALADAVIQQSAFRASDIIFYHTHDPTFPSNGATISFAAATGIWLGHRKAGLFIFFLAFLWSFARFYGGVHFFVDILTGAFIGVLTALLISKVFMPRTEPCPTWALNACRFLYIA